MPDASTAPAPPDLLRQAAAEGFGTFILVFFAVGTAVFGIESIGSSGSRLPSASPCSPSPTASARLRVPRRSGVALGFLMHKGITGAEAVAYWVAQAVGAVIGAALLKLLVSGFGGATDETGGLGTNDWGDSISMGGAFVLEIVLTFLLVFVVLLVTNRAAAPGFAGLAIGIVLAAIHLVGIPLDGTSVNPARSLGPAVFNGGDSLAHLWLFIVAPLIGGAVAAVVAPLFETGTSTIDTDPTGADVPE